MDGKLVAVKTISPDYIENSDTFKRVRPPPSKTSLIDPIFGAPTETVHEWGRVEAITAPKCAQFSRVLLRRSSFLPCIPLDVQRELVRLCPGEPQCQQTRPGRELLQPSQYIE